MAARQGQWAVFTLADFQRPRTEAAGAYLVAACRVALRELLAIRGDDGADAPLGSGIATIRHALARAGVSEQPTPPPFDRHPPPDRSGQDVGKPPEAPTPPQ